MKTYIDLCDATTFDSIRNILEEYYWIRTEVLEFAFWIYGRNEETLENICYYYWIDEDELLKEAWIEDEEEEEEEND